jgi:Ribbon-helix-helix protein, copG family.
MRVVTFKLENYLVDWINTLSIKYRISRSELIRRAILYYISHLEEVGKNKKIEVRAYELR